MSCQSGLHGWEVTDLKVTFTQAEYYSPVSTPADFRQLTPYVFRLALQQSGVDILEPMLCFELQIPQVASSKAITDLQKLMSEIEDISCNNEWCHIKGKVPLNTSKDYASEVSSYTKGLGIFMVKPCGYQITKDGYSDNIRMNEKDKLLFMFQKINVIKIMERSGNFYKAIRLGYILISILIGCMAYNSLYEWQEIEALELGNKKIDELRKEINNINIQMIKFSLLGETILEWNDKDIEHYHARRMAMDSMLCRFKATYPAERIDSVRSLLEDKERQMFQIVRLMDEQQSINKKIANQIPVIVQKSVQEQSKKPKRKGFLGIFGKKKEVTPAVSTTILHSVNRNVISEQKVQDRQLSEQADSLAARNAELNRQLQELICQIEEKVQTELQSRENEIVAMREKSFMQVGGLMGFVLLLLLISYIIIHRDAKSIKQYKHKTTDLIRATGTIRTTERGTDNVKEEGGTYYHP